MPLFKNAAVKEIEGIITELQLNLENNYKDTARDALNRLGQTIEQMKTGGRLTDRQYKKFIGIFNEYSVKMTGYHH